MEKDFKYTHYMGYVKPNPDWNKDLTCNLVKNYKELKNKLSELQQNSNTLKKEMETMKEDKKELEDKVSKLTKSVNTLKEE